MSDELFPAERGTLLVSGTRRVTLSRKQRSVVAYLEKNGEMTLSQATALIGGDIYANAEKHVGALLSNMVNRGLLIRTKPGVFKLPPLRVA